MHNDSVITYSNNLASSRPHPQKVFDRGYNCTSDVDNLPRQTFNFRKSQYGRVSQGKSPATLQPKWGSASYPSGYTSSNRARKYEDDIGDDDSVANTETLSAKQRQDDAWSFGENTRYNAATRRDVARAHSPVESATIARGGSTSKPWRSGGTPAQDSIVKHRLHSVMAPHNTSRFRSSLIVDKFNRDEFSDLDPPVTNHCRDELFNDARHSVNKSLGRVTSKAHVETGLFEICDTCSDFSLVNIYKLIYL